MESNYNQHSNYQSNYQVKRKQQPEQKEQQKKHNVHPIRFTHKHKKEIKNVARGAVRKVAKYAKFV